ncbi:MAG TPA: NFYB/HAP3 family transcription factor subunit [Methanocorpusculum sp.]|nr:NFYB/HAP3 family transcription factor subunit [Methanocorpusculum sp.]
MADLPKAAVIRLAKKAGAERVGADATDALVRKAEVYINRIAKKAFELAKHAGRKTIKVEDVELATK